MLLKLWFVGPVVSHGPYTAELWALTVALRFLQSGDPPEWWRDPGSAPETKSDFLRDQGESPVPVTLPVPATFTQTITPCVLGLEFLHWCTWLLVFPVHGNTGRTVQFSLCSFSCGGSSSPLFTQYVAACNVDVKVWNLSDIKLPPLVDCPVWHNKAWCQSQLGYWLRGWA